MAFNNLVILFFSFIFISIKAQPGEKGYHNYTPYRIWIVGDSDLFFTKKNDSMLTPENILQNYNVYLQYLGEKKIEKNSWNNKLSLTTHNIHNFYSKQKSGQLSKKRKKKIAKYLEIIIPSMMLPIRAGDSLLTKILPYGSNINLCLENKLTQKKMSIIIKTNISEYDDFRNQYFKIKNLSFREGFYFLDFTQNKFNAPMTISQSKNLIKTID